MIQSPHAPGLSPKEITWTSKASSRAASPSLASDLTLARRRGHTASGMRLGRTLPPVVDSQQETSNNSNNEQHQSSVHNQANASKDSHSGTIGKRYGMVNLSYVPPSSASSQKSSVSSAKLQPQLDWKRRIRHFTWSFFSVTMATGGVANVIYHVPYRFRGLDTIGVIFFLFNFAMFILFSILISIRFIKYPETLKASITHPSESLFMPCFVASLGTVLLNITFYGLGNTGYWLTATVVVLFWINVALAVLSSATTYVMIWSTQSFTIAEMTPVWIAPAYTLLVVGPIAGGLAIKLDTVSGFGIVVGGFTCQGIGFLVALTIYSAFIYRLMTQKLPKEALRPAMFVSVGPAAFTASALISLSAAAQKCLPDDFLGDGTLVGTIIMVVANFSALWLWGLSTWFFIISIAAHVSCIGHGGIEFALSWWSFIFPNSTLLAATFAVGKAFNSSFIQWTACILTIFLVIGWFFVFAMMIRAIIQKQILWPQKQDDRDEGGFIAPKPRSETLQDKGLPI